MNRLRHISGLLIVAGVTIMVSPPAWGQRSGAGQLHETVDRLVPYDLSGPTAEALAELTELANSVDARTAYTARFLRAAAAVDLYTYAALVGDGEMRRQLARAMSVEDQEILVAIEAELREVSWGTFEGEALSCRAVLYCSRSEARQRWCGPALRRVDGADRAGASAARMLLIEGALRRAARSRELDGPTRAMALELEAAQVCAEPVAAEQRRRCRAIEAASGDRARSEAQVRAVMGDVGAALARLERAEAGGDPMGQLGAEWRQSVSRRMGWAVHRRHIDHRLVGELALPEATSEAVLPPVELLLIRDGEALVALSSVVAQTVTGPVALDERTGLALPGQPIEGLPRRFRPVIRPLDAVTEALNDARGRLTEALAELGEPSWGEPPERVLGLLVDGSINLIDLARYVSSAREAGFDRFVLLGQRSDGLLATIPAEFGSVQQGPEPSTLPRLRVAPRDVTFEPPEEFPIEIPRDELIRLGQRARPFLAEGRIAFAAQARPMMPLRMVLPSIDAVVSAASGRSPGVLFMLPP